MKQTEYNVDAYIQGLVKNNWSLPDYFFHIKTEARWGKGSKEIQKVLKEVDSGSLLALWQFYQRTGTRIQQWTNYCLTTSTCAQKAQKDFVSI